MKARKVVAATRRLRNAHAAWGAGEISFARFDAHVQGWINHVRDADTWGLRGHVLGGLPLDGPRGPVDQARGRGLVTAARV